ncbi:hypothetical protein V1477_019471 [Vespula maculifrons]|uniref:Uncharacterized protein n=1 Tax=Vespula maculifrons TaxID=7453 RepID=A0ABD2AVA3_VESMC
MIIGQRIRYWKLQYFKYYHFYIISITAVCPTILIDSLSFEKPLILGKIFSSTKIRYNNVNDRVS